MHHVFVHWRRYGLGTAIAIAALLVGLLWYFKYYQPRASSSVPAARPAATNDVVQAIQQGFQSLEQKLQSREAAPSTPLESGVPAATDDVGDENEILRPMKRGDLHRSIKKNVDGIIASRTRVATYEEVDKEVKRALQPFRSQPAFQQQR